MWNSVVPIWTVVLGFGIFIYVALDGFGLCARMPHGFVPARNFMTSDGPEDRLPQKSSSRGDKRQIPESPRSGTPNDRGRPEPWAPLGILPHPGEGRSRDAFAPARFE